MNPFSLQAQFDLWHSVIADGAPVNYEDFNLDLLDLPHMRDCIALTAISPTGYRYSAGDSLHNTGANHAEPNVYRFESAVKALIFLAGENVDSVYKHDHLCAMLAYLFWSVKVTMIAEPWALSTFDGTAMSELVKSALHHRIPGYFRIPKTMASRFLDTLPIDLENARFGLTDSADDPSPWTRSHILGLTD